MKFALAFLTIAVCLFSAAQANPDSRYKRSQTQEPCPMDVLCENYAKDRVKQLGPCTSYEVKGDSVTILQCGRAYCGDNGKEVQDLNKPFPECCPDCEVIDPSKPFQYSRTL